MSILNIFKKKEKKGTIPVRREQILKEYTIRWGETLTTIAERFHTTVADLVELNERMHREIMFPGDEILIPC